MPYLEGYAARVRNALAGVDGVTEKKMFGSLGFLLNGHLTVGVGDGKDGNVIMVRVGKDGEDEALKFPGASTTIMRGRPMHGWIDLTPEAVATDTDLSRWVDTAVGFVTTLPAKTG